MRISEPDMTSIMHMLPHDELKNFFYMPLAYIYAYICIYVVHYDLTAWRCHTNGSATGHQ